jgi:hypothetical protein
MRRLSVILREAAQSLATIARGALRFIGAAYVEWLNTPGIYLLAGSRGTRDVAQP